MDKNDDHFATGEEAHCHNPPATLRSIARRNARPAPLEELDDTRKKVTWRQVRTILISSTGFFTDAYDIFIINLVTPMLGYIYYKNSGNKMPSGIQGPFKGMVSFGQLIGQLLFGFLGDALGRKAIYGLELILIIISTINCATSASAVEGVGAVGFLGFWRFFLGMGIGGDYPLSSSVAAEWSSAGRRGQMVALIFSMQGFGQVAAALVTMIVLACFKGAVQSNVDNLDYVWRICIGLGAVPAVLTVYGRLTMPESPRYAVKVQNNEKGAMGAMEATSSWRKTKKKNKNKQEQDEQNNDDEIDLEQQRSRSSVSLRRRAFLLSQALDDEEIGLAKLKTGGSVEYSPAHPKTQKQIRKENMRDFIHHFGKWPNLKLLLGASLSWFFMDIAFYGTNLNQALILSSMGFAPEDLAPWDTLFKQALGNLILSVLGALPGYIVSVLLIEKIGRKPIQFLGFILVGIIFIILGAAWGPIHQVSVALFIVLFAIAMFFFNFGPNTTTFVFPAEIFPTRHRAKAHGISAASGKLGAIIATFAFNSLADVGGQPGERHFLPSVLIIFGALMLLCIIFTTWMPEPKGRSLDYFEAMNGHSEHSSTETQVEEAHGANAVNVNSNRP